MTARSPRLSAVEGRVWNDLLEALITALARGRPRPLRRLIEDAGLQAVLVERELAAFPGGACAARSDLLGLDMGRCLAGKGCPVEKECPFPGSGVGSHLGRALSSLARGGIVPLVCSSPLNTLSDLRRDLAELLLDHPRLAGAAGPRARTSLALLDRALARGGPLGATGPFLPAPELEQIAAFLPPGSGRRKPEKAAAEAWLRRVASAGAAVVEFHRGG